MINVADYMPLVWSIAGQVIARCPHHVEIGDLIGEGSLALCEAGRRYEVDRGANFQTYASWRVRGAMLDFLRIGDIPSRSDRRFHREYLSSVDSYVVKRGMLPTHFDMSSSLGVSDERLDVVLNECEFCTKESFDVQVDEKDMTLADVTPDYTVNSPLDIAEYNNHKGILAEMLVDLSEQELFVYNLHIRDGRTITDTAEVLGVSDSRISQITLSAKKKLKEWGSAYV